LRHLQFFSGNNLAKNKASDRGQGSGRFTVLRLLAGALVFFASHAQAVETPAAVGEGNAAASIDATRAEYDAVLAPSQLVVVDNPYGDVSARFGGFEHKVEVDSVLQEPVGATHIDLTPAVDGEGRYRISPTLPAGKNIAEGQRIDLEVFVPEGHALSVHTEQGSIEVRGVHGDVTLKSTGGNINLRGIKGVIQAETGDGQIDAALTTAPRKSSQRLATSTGDINLAVDDRLDAELDMTTSSLFATEYSLKITRMPGQEPNKRAQALIGENHSRLDVESRRGQIRVSRRTSFTSVGVASSASTEQEEEQEDNDSD